MRLRLLTFLLLLALLGATSRSVVAGRPSLKGLWDAFEEAPSLEAQRAVLARLEAWPPNERVKVMGGWIKKVPEEPESVALLARAMLEASPGAATRRIRNLLKDEDYAPVRAGLLRVLMDAPETPGLKARTFGATRITNPAAYLLATRMTDAPGDLPASRAARTLHDLDAVDALLGEPAAPGAWAAVGRLLHGLVMLSPRLRAELARRVREQLPKATAGDLAGWPQTWLIDLWQAGEMAALGAVIGGSNADTATAILEGLRRTRDPASVEPLVEALARAPRHSAAFHRVLGILQDLTGSRVPADPDQWRSWIAGHRAWLDAQDTLPETESSEAAVNLGIAFLLDRQQADGSFVYGTGRQGHPYHRTGTTALCLYALRKAGMPKDAPPLHRAAAYLLLRESESQPPIAFYYNYAAGIAAMALEALDRDRYRHGLEQLVLHLTAGQQASGGWTYHLPYGTRAQPARQIDLSNTQYSVLGLRSAAFARLPIDPEVWKGVLRLMREAEIRETGEWRYVVPSKGPRSGMAAIAAASMLIARSQLEKGLKLEEVLADAQIVRALRSMARKYGRKDRYDELDHYTLYSIERVGALFGVYSFDGVPWYAEGTRVLLERQLADGGWGVKDETIKWWQSWGRNVDTAYALLFLKRATTPVFSAGLDVPSDPRRPIRRVQPNRTDLPAGANHRVDGDAGGKPAVPATGTQRIGHLRRTCRELLTQRLAAADSPADRLVVWRALAAVDPLHALAHVMAGETMGASGAWQTDPAVDASLPAGESSSWARTAVRSVLEQTAFRAMAEASGKNVSEREGRALVAFALALKRAARTAVD